MKSIYTTVVDFSEDTHEKVTRKICGRGYVDYKTVYVPKGQNGDVAIPPRRTVKLDLSGIEEAKNWSNKVRSNFS